MNKTGTTSIGKLLAYFGYKIGDQPTAELFIEDWAKRDFRKIVKYCKTADAFKDVPFCLDHTYTILDYAYPGSKFILTVRNSSLEWYNSLIRFHSNLIGNGKLPTAEEIESFEYHNPGWLWRAHQIIFNVDKDLLYDKEHYIKHYELHNNRVKDYFRFRTDDLLVLNVADKNAVQLLCDFLVIKNENYTMPHLMKSN